MLDFIDNAPRHLFFTGKGGVGKTSLACATAVALADRGHRVLLVSTDPASNLGQVLETNITATTVRVAGVANLLAVNIDPEAAARAYRERVVGPVRGILPEEAVKTMEEQLSGACTTEIAAFDEFTKLLANPEQVGQFDHIVFDTAPTGHTLRLLQLPAAWSSFIDTNPDGSSCLGPLSGLGARQAQFTAAVGALNDPDQTLLILVSRPERSALEEAARTSVELESQGIRNQYLVVNGIFHTIHEGDPLAVALAQRADDALRDIPEALHDLRRAEVPLKSYNVIGLAALRSMLVEEDAPEPDADAAPVPIPEVPPLNALIDELATAGKGLVMVMGKGGVGKTTIAAAVAVALAARGIPVHLSTTDPAAHLDGTLNGDVDGLQVSRIDPKVETQRYIDTVLVTKGKDLDAEERALLEEDLRSPCTEEVAVFHAFSRVVRDAGRGFVVLDTAPTGHTLLLLDAAGSYHREVLRNTRLSPDRVTTPLMRLQDPAYSKLLLVTLPETTPVLEAAGLQADLQRAGIEPYAWIVNQSLAAAKPSEPMLARRAHAELNQIKAVQERHAARTFIVPLQVEEPVGFKALLALAEEVPSDPTPVTEA